MITQVESRPSCDKPLLLHFFQKLVTTDRTPSSFMIDLQMTTVSMTTSNQLCCFYGEKKETMTENNMRLTGTSYSHILISLHVRVTQIFTHHLPSVWLNPSEHTVPHTSSFSTSMRPSFDIKRPISLRMSSTKVNTFNIIITHY